MKTKSKQFGIKCLPVLFSVALALGTIKLHADPGTDYGSWATAPGWPGLNYRVKRNSSSPGDQTFTWWVQFENTYNQPITFSFNLTPPNSPSPTLTDGMTLGAGRESADWFIVGSHDSVQVWVGQVTLGNGTTSNAGGSQNATSSSQSSSVQSTLQQQQVQLQQQQQLQQQAAQERQQQLQQQQAALQQQIADKRAELQAQQTALEEKRQQIINNANAKNNAYLALGSAVQNATDQIADMLQQQEQQREADDAKRQLQEQEDDLENQQRQLQDQLDQLQQQAADNQNNNQNNQNVQNNYSPPPAPVVVRAAPPPPEPAHPLVQLSSFFSSDSAPAQKPAASSDLSWITDDKKKSDSSLSWITDDPNNKSIASTADKSNAGGVGYYYRVHSGDTLSAIAQAYRNQAHIAVTVDDILKANPGLDADNMKAGQKIFVPRDVTETAQPDIMKQLDDVLH